MAEFSIVPIGEGPSISSHVAKAVQVIEESGLLYRVTPMGTIIEGDWDRVFSVIKRCVERVLEESDRITCSIKIDYRKEVDRSRMEEKVRKVEEKVGKPIRR